MTVEQIYSFVEPSLINSGKEVKFDIDVSYAFIVYDGKLALAMKDYQSHKKIALGTELFYPETKGHEEPMVDDGGIIIDYGDRLVIKDYFTEGCCPKKLFEARSSKEEINIKEMEINLRRETGQLISNILNRDVTIELNNDTDEIISSNNI